MKIDDPRIREALQCATNAQKRAYVPYSGFKMGAAVVTDADAVVAGVLVENVSLGLAMCAERVALFAAMAQDAGKPEILVLVSRPTDGELTWPCGACLQVASELAGPELVVVACDGTRTELRSLADLAPLLPRKK